jgi:integrase
MSAPSSLGGDMIEQYVESLQRRRLSRNTVRLRLFYLTKFQLWLCRDLATGTYADFDAYIWANPDWSDNTRQCATATIKAFYRWAYREGLIPENPARDLPRIDVHRPRQRIASETAIRHAIQCDDISDRAMVLLGAECGLRVTEIATLHLDNRDGEWLRIIGKGNHQRTLHLSPELGALLDELERTRMRHGWFFPGRSGISPMHPSTAWRHITTVLNSNPHSLRRRAGTVVYRQSGHDIRLAQLFLGHATSATTELYLDIRDDDIVTAGNLTRIAA